MTKLRILMINHEYTITGASMVFLRLAQHLQNEGHEISILPCLPADGPIRARYTHLGIPIISRASSSEFDLCIANTIFTAPFIVRADGRVKTIWFIHEAEVGLDLLLKFNDRIPAFGLASAIVFQTAFQRDVYRSFTYQLPARKFHIIANGIDAVPHTLPAVPEKQRRLRIVQVGSLVPRKRPSDLIRAVARGRLDAECVLCGKFFELDDEATALVAARPETFFLTGEIEPEHVLAWVRSADIYALVSESESQPLSVLEAAAMAKPLLLTSLPAYEGQFAHGRNCLMAPPGHIELLAHMLGIYDASPGLRRELGDAARRTAAGFTSAAFFARFDTLIAATVSP